MLWSVSGFVVLNTVVWVWVIKLRSRTNFNLQVQPRQERSVEGLHARVNKALRGRPLSPAGLCMELKWNDVESMVCRSPKELRFGIGWRVFCLFSIDGGSETRIGQRGEPALSKVSDIGNL